MGKRVAAILVIFLCSTLAWVVLGGTIMTRTYSLDELAPAEGRVDVGESADPAPAGGLLQS